MRKIVATTLCILATIILLNLSATANHNTDTHIKNWLLLDEATSEAYYSGKFKEGVVFAEKAYSFALAYLGQSHPNTLTSINNLALLYQTQGRYGEAETFYKEALTLRKKELGHKHPSTLTSIYNLGHLYHVLGRYVEAEKLYKEALQIREKVLGRKHSSTLTSINTLAGLYKNQARYVEAETLFKKALQIQEKVLGRNNSHTQDSIHNLAGLYVSLGRFEKAEKLYKETLRFRVTAFGREHPFTLPTLNNMAGLYVSLGRYEKAEKLYKEALQILEKKLGREHPKTQITINNLGLLYCSLGRYSEAETLYKEALQILEKKLGREHPKNLNSIYNLASLYRVQGQYKESEKLFKEVLQIRENILGRKHPDTLVSINGMAELYDCQGRYREAEKLYKEALQIREKILGREHPDTLTSISNIAKLYISQGRYKEAETLYKEALQIWEKVLGRKHPNTLSSINNLAELYGSQGRYNESETLHKEALQVRKKILGREHPDTLTSINNLAGLHNYQGRYGKAENLYKEMLQIQENLLGRKHPNTLSSINNLAELYGSQGRFKEAEPLHKEALQTRENVLGHEHPDTLNSINNLAGLYKIQGRYKEAEALHKEALKIREKVLGHEHPNTLNSINNLAGLYKIQGRYKEAEALHKEALKIREKVLGHEHPDTLISINTLAELYKVQGRYKEAETLFKEALQIQEKVLIRDHPNTLTTQLNYISLMIKTNQAQNAYRNLKTVENRLLSRSFQELYSVSTERIRRVYLKKISIFQDMVLSFCKKNPAYQRFAANIILRWKQIYAEETVFQHRLLSLSQDPKIVALRKDFTELRNNLSQCTHNLKHREKAAELWFKLKDLDKKLRSISRNFNSKLMVSGTTVDQVLSSLPPKSGLIEFRFYKQVNFKTGKLGKTHLGAYLLLSDFERDQQVYFKDLGEMDTIFQAFSAIKKRDYLIYEKTLGLFDEQIKGLEKLYIAPDGFLNLISFASLKVPGGLYLVQRQQVNRLLTGRDLVKTNFPEVENILVAFGGIIYGKSSNPLIKEDEYLDHSLYEVETIRSIYKSNCKEGKNIIFKGKDATETRLKELETPPRILHLATHGFFLENANIQDWAEEEAPLLLSGLALAGANRGLEGETDKNGEDGLLYSLEVLGLNLQGTELVSLAACDTGKGVIDESEGVYGLVRAFRTAGAQSVLMTLQPVLDYSTRIFMETFYDNWLGSQYQKTPSEALHQTRLDFLEHSEKTYRNPEIWSPYVVVGH